MNNGSIISQTSHKEYFLCFFFSFFQEKTRNYFSALKSYLFWYRTRWISVNLWIEFHEKPAADTTSNTFLHRQNITGRNWDAVDKVLHVCYENTKSLCFQKDLWLCENFQLNSWWFYQIWSVLDHRSFLFLLKLVIQHIMAIVKVNFFGFPNQNLGQIDLFLDQTMLFKSPLRAICYFNHEGVAEIQLTIHLCSLWSLAHLFFFSLHWSISLSLFHHVNYMYFFFVVEMVWTSKTKQQCVNMYSCFLVNVWLSFLATVAFQYCTSKYPLSCDCEENGARFGSGEIFPTDWRWKCLKSMVNHS